MKIYGQLGVAQLENLGSDPTAATGRIYYNTGDDTFRYYSAGASAWRTLVNTTNAMTNPLTTNGDIIYGVGSTPTRLALGTAGRVLVAGASAPAYTANLSVDSTTGALTAGPSGGVTSGYHTILGSVVLSNTQEKAGIISASTMILSANRYDEQGGGIKAVKTATGYAFASVARQTTNGGTVFSVTANYQDAQTAGSTLTTTNEKLIFQLTAAGACTIGASGGGGTVTLNGNICVQIGASGSPNYFATDSTANGGGKKWRLGYSGGTGGSAATCDFYNETDAVMGATATATGCWTFGASATLTTHQMTVNSASPNSVLQLNSTAASDSGVAGIRLVKTANDSTTAQKYLSFLINTSTACGSITANGANTAAFTSFSDARLKENIVALPSQLANILALKPSEFDYRDGSGHQIGFIAQDMQKIYPDSVGFDVHPNGESYLTVTAWSKTEARLVSAIQEMHGLVMDLRARIAQLEGPPPAAPAPAAAADDDDEDDDETPSKKAPAAKAKAAALKGRKK